MRKIFLFTAVLISTLFFTQSEKVVYPHTVFWSKIEANEIFDNKFGVGLDFVYRTRDEMNDGQLFDNHLRTSIRPWIHYQFGKNSRLSLSPLGYMDTTEYIGKESDYNRLPYHELRSTLQFFHHQKSNSGKWMHTWRYRYEWRWQERAGLDEYRYFQRFRFRYRLRYILNGNDFYKDKTFYLAASNEIGLNIGKNVVWNTFNQNRIYAGIGYRFLNSARVELRYVNRFRTRGATGYEFDNDNGIMLGLYIDQLSDLGRKQIERVKFAD